jgi:hypothetical protein
VGGFTLKTVKLYFYEIDGQWTAYTKDFGVGYSNKQYELAREQILDGVRFFYEPTEIVIEEKIVSSIEIDKLYEIDNFSIHSASDE